MKGMTKRQRQIVDYIQEYISENGYSPSYREIMRHFGFSSLGSVYKHISVLKRRGILNAEKNSARSVVLATPERPSVAPGSVVEVPFLGIIAAGVPIETFPQAGTITVPSGMVSDARKSYVLQVRGDSMIDDHILDGDLIVVEARSTANPGETVVALLNRSETTLKRYHPEGEYVRLEPANPNFKPITVRRALRFGSGDPTPARSPRPGAFPASCRRSRAVGSSSPPSS